MWVLAPVDKILIAPLFLPIYLFDHGTRYKFYFIFDLFFQQCMGHSTPNRAAWKIVIFDFLHFFDIFLLPIKKLFLINFEIFLITGLKCIKFRLSAPHNFFKNGHYMFWLINKPYKNAIGEPRLELGVHIFGIIL